MERHLLIGCGNKRDKRIRPAGSESWQNLVTLDIDPKCQPDTVWDLNSIPLPFEDNSFTEIHAYEVLEHVGTQGDYHFFFAQFYDFWRMLKPKGVLCVTVPLYKSQWAWGDPGHRRVIAPGSLVFLSQKEYETQVGVTAMSDYRDIWKGDFVVEYMQEAQENFLFALRALKETT